MARIVNKLNPTAATLCGSLKEAKEKLDGMLRERRARGGWSVIEERDNDGPVYRVVNERGVTEEILYIEE